MDATSHTARTAHLLGYGAGGVVSLGLYGACAWLMVVELQRANDGGFFVLPPFVGYAAAAAGLVLWIIGSAFQAH